SLVLDGAGIQEIEFIFCLLHRFLQHVLTVYRLAILHLYALADVLLRAAELMLKFSHRGRGLLVLGMISSKTRLHIHQFLLRFIQSLSDFIEGIALGRYLSGLQGAAFHRLISSLFPHTIRLSTGVLCVELE